MSGGGETSRAAPLRTPLKRARGLGSGKAGDIYPVFRELFQRRLVT